MASTQIAQPPLAAADRISRLPNELILGIFENLGDDQDLRSIILTSRKFHHLANDHLLKQNALGSGTILRWACAAGHLSLVKSLLDHGADINQTWPGDELPAGTKELPRVPNSANTKLTPLVTAIIAQQVKVVTVLISRGADPDAHSEYIWDEHPLNIAVLGNAMIDSEVMSFANRRAIIDLLLPKPRPEEGQSSPDRESPIYTSLIREDAPFDTFQHVVHRIQDLGISRLAFSNYDMNLFFEYQYHNELTDDIKQKLRLLSRCGVWGELLDSCIPPMSYHLCDEITDEDVELAKIFISGGAPINASLSLVLECLESWAAQEQAEGHPSGPLQFEDNGLATARFYQILELLLDEGASPNRKDAKHNMRNETPLCRILALEGPFLKTGKLVRLFLSHGASPSQVGKEGNVTPLHIACDLKLLSQTRYLLQATSPDHIDVRDSKHRTPFHYLCGATRMPRQNEPEGKMVARKRIYIANLLVGHGACKTATDIWDKTPLYYAQHHVSKEFHDYLVRLK
ncbi:hypothetical protein JX266_000935 [Neoarthrinium moseri]|nr:hypothetical protein JX266_000935 [Neoarthrinium moseri]